MFEPECAPTEGLPLKLRVGGRWSERARPLADAALGAMAPIRQLCPLPGGDVLLALGDPESDGVLRVERCTQEGQSRWTAGGLHTITAASDGSAVVARGAEETEVIDPATGLGVARAPIDWPYVVPTGASHLLGRHALRERRLARWPLTGEASAQVIALLDVGWLVAAGDRAIVGSGHELYRVRQDKGTALQLPRPRIPRTIQGAAISPDGRWLAIRGHFAVAMLDLEREGAVRWSTRDLGLKGTPLHLSWHADGMLAVGGSKGHVALLTPRLAPEELSRVFDSGLGPVDALAVDADGRGLWIAGARNAVRIPLLLDERDADASAGQLVELDEREDDEAAAVLDDLLRERGWRG